MAELARTVITTIDRLSEAVQKSIIGGQAQFSFAGRAATTENAEEPTHCMSSGFVDEILIADYESDPNYFVSEHVGRQWPQALLDHSPVLYVWYPEDVE
jgi:hypothetical protein